LDEVCGFTSNFLSLGFMIGYLGYCKRVEQKEECVRLAEAEEADKSENDETEYVPKSSRLFWADLKTLLSEKLNSIEFTDIIK